MSLAPVPISGGRREVPFNAETVKNLLTRLLTETVEDVESETVEIKSWCNNDRDLGEKASEAAACLANAGGGLVLVGIEERAFGSKFSSCPHSNVREGWLTGRIQDLTVPPVECAVRDVSDILAQVAGASDSTVFAISVARSRHHGGHLTTKGVSKIRVGRDCKPRFTAEDDRSRSPAPDITLDDLSQRSIDYAMSQHERRFGTPRQHWSSAIEFLEHAQLVQPFLPDEEIEPRYRITLAGLLLFGKPSVLKMSVPFFETVVVTDTGTKRFHANIVDSVREVCSSDSPVPAYLSPHVSPETLRELMVNAYVHRCYRLPGPIMVRADSRVVEIQSPGELPSGLHVSHLIHCVPVYRNLLLAEGARFIGLCDKIGLGIDIVVRSVLAGGYAFPEFESNNDQFTARISLEGSAHFREFVRQKGSAVQLLDELIALRMLWSKETVHLTELSAAMQRSPEAARRVLSEMTNKLMVEETQYWVDRLSSGVRRDIEHVFQSDQLPLDPSLWGV